MPAAPEARSGPTEPRVGDPTIPDDAGNAVGAPGAPNARPANPPSPPLLGPCGLSPDDWCPAFSGDPCGEHPDAAACRADDRCEVLPHRGESVVACIAEERCFAMNCPAVGCVSRCESPAGQLDCTSHSPRCGWQGDRCATLLPCRGYP